VEGASSNLFLWNGRSWITPPLNQGPLPGVMRRVLLTLMQRQQIPFEERSISIHELTEAQEAILTNAIWEILPLTGWEGRLIASGHVGDQTRKLQQGLAGEIQSRHSQK
jgi:branched-subunit amino acid aminotransferase/4-amino-4-deoxychorismate lyase